MTKKKNKNYIFEFFPQYHHICLKKKLLSVLKEGSFNLMYNFSGRREFFFCALLFSGDDSLTDIQQESH
ncbi:MAG: hypothetical protein D3922_13165 [Candidatus Electrothrix sp. AR1]|nr:hypothetical protein [Candidatus Electrothrix sp. AR1]